MDLDALLRVPVVAGFDASPDGKEAATIWNATGSYQVHRLDAITGDERSHTAGPQTKMGLRYSPDSRRLAYGQDFGGDENFDVFLIDTATGESVSITPSTEYAIYPNMEFSPDSKSLTFCSNATGKFSAYTVNSDGTDLARITDHAFSDYYAVWSPDGRRLAVEALVSGQDTGIFVCNTDGSDPVRVSETGKVLDASGSAWSPDSKNLAFQSSSKDWYDIGVYDLVSETVEWLTNGGKECYEPTWSPDGRTVAFLVNWGDRTGIRLAGIGRSNLDVEAGSGIHGSPKFSKDGGRIYSLFDSPAHTRTLWYYSVAEGRFFQLTPSHGEPEGATFVFGREVRSTSLDGTGVPCLLYTPRKANGRGIVHIHGGPMAQSMNDWNPFLQELISRGYAVICPNYRGSTGFGRAYREGNRFKMGKVDLEDCISARDYLIEHGLADRDGIAVTGGSYGGYLTMLALTKRPELWRCGSALVPFINWFTEVENEREDLRHWDVENMGDPEADGSRYRDASPAFFLDRISAPVQIIGGANDPRCPAEEIEQARTQLDRLGKEIDVKVFSDEGHSFRKIENRVAAYTRMAEFIDSH